MRYFGAHIEQLVGGKACFLLYDLAGLSGRVGSSDVVKGPESDFLLFEEGNLVYKAQTLQNTFHGFDRVVLSFEEFKFKMNQGKCASIAN